METIKLNDQIVLLRKCVKIAKVHTVRRLFRQMKCWRQKKGKTEEETRKNQRKAERIKEEISLITKARPDVISKMALTEEKEWNKILRQKDITIEERSFARLISHKNIQKKIAEFREANPDWQLWIPLTLKKWKRRKLIKLEKMNSAVKDTSLNSENESNMVDKSDLSDNASNSENENHTVNKLDLSDTALNSEDESNTVDKSDTALVDKSDLSDTASNSENENNNTVDKSDLSDTASNSENENNNTVDKSDLSDTEEQDKDKKIKKPLVVTSKKRDHNKNKSSLGNKQIIKRNKGTDLTKLKNSKNKTNKKAKANKRGKHKVREEEYNNLIKKCLEKSKSDVLDKVEGSMEITQINLDNLRDSESIPLHHNSSTDINVPKDDSIKPPKKKSRDVFFLRTDEDESDQESISESGHSVSSSKELSNNEIKTQFVSSLSGGRKDFSQLHKRINPKFFHKEDQNTNTSFPMNRRQRRERERRSAEMSQGINSNSKREFCSYEERPSFSSIERRNDEDGTSKSKLHPSWEAKKKMRQVTILPFKGKKIKFDVND